MPEEHTLTGRKIFIFWSPLALMWLLMAVEQPIITAVISRLNLPAVNLAAYGVAFAFALIVESPVIQMLLTGTALSHDRQHYRKLLSFMHFMGVGLTLLHLLIGISPAYGFFLRSVMGAPVEIIAESRSAFLILTPFTVAVGYRRLWQGVLIRYNKTAIIPFTTVARLVAIIAIMGTGYKSGLVSGASLGALAISGGVILGAVSSYLYARPIIKNLPGRIGGSFPVLEWKGLFTFYMPLSLTAMLSLFMKPVLAVGMARSPFPLESLAVWPVVDGYFFLFGAMALSYQEAALTLMKESRERLKTLRTFTIRLAFGLAAFYLAVALTPLGTWYFKTLTGLPTAIYPYVFLPLVILAPITALFTFESWLRANLVRKKRTGIIARAMVVQFFTLCSIMVLGAAVLPFPGAVSAALAFLLAMIAENVYLVLHQ